MIQFIIGNPPQSYGASPANATRDHTVLPAVRRRWTRPAITQAGTRFAHPWGMKGWVDIGVGYTEMVYLSADGHISKYWLLCISATGPVVWRRPCGSGGGWADVVEGRSWSQSVRGTLNTQRLGVQSQWTCLGVRVATHYHSRTCSETTPRSVSPRPPMASR